MGRDGREKRFGRRSQRRSDEEAELGREPQPDRRKVVDLRNRGRRRHGGPPLRLPTPVSGVQVNQSIFCFQGNLD